MRRQEREWKREEREEDWSSQEEQWMRGDRGSVEYPARKEKDRRHVESES